MTSPNHRLAPDLQADLTWYWCEAEAELGVRSSTGAQITRLEVGAGSRAAIRQAADRERKQQAEIDAADAIGLTNGARVRIRLALAAPETGKRRARRDALLRAYMLFGPVHEQPPSSIADPFPDGAERARSRMVRVHAAITSLGRSPGGPQHQRVLYRVYGPRTPHLPSYGRVGPELAPLVEYTAVWSPTSASKPTDAWVRAARLQAGQLLADASEAYGAAWRGVVDERREAKRAAFRAIMGGA